MLDWLVGMGRVGSAAGACGAGSGKREQSRAEPSRSEPELRVGLSKRRQRPAFKLSSPAFTSHRLLACRPAVQLACRLVAVVTAQLYSFLFYFFTCFFTPPRPAPLPLVTLPSHPPRLLFSPSQPTLSTATRPSHSHTHPPFPPPPVPSQLNSHTCPSPFPFPQPPLAFATTYQERENNTSP